MNAAEKISKQVMELPPYLLPELESYIEFLRQNKNVRRKKNRFKQNWAGALKEFNSQYTALELQKKALEWRSEY